MTGLLLALLLAASAPAQTPETINRQAPPTGEPIVADASPKKSAAVPGYTIIPLPAFTYNRNEGSWIGGLLPIFRANEKGEVEDIYAPLYLHNELIGETFTFNYFGYRDRTKQYQVVASYATKIERALDVRYKDTAVGEAGRGIVFIKIDSGKSAFNRFYGFGGRSSAQNESTYTMGDSNLKLAAGIKLSHGFALTAQERLREVTIENGASRTLPQTLEKFPDVPGVKNGSDIWGQSVTLQHDTRDNSLTPLSGDLATMTAEFARDFQNADHPSWFRFTGEARAFFPHSDDRAVFVVHALIDAVIGQRQRVVPFYERPTLGGESTLRGYGRGRYVGDSATLLNLEERLNLIRHTVMGNLIELEIAPFLDIGRVAVGSLQFNPGVGVRVLARPNVAGRLDIANGHDGVSVFVGLDYPF